MAKRPKRRRSAFPVPEQRETQPRTRQTDSQSIVADDSVGGIYGFFRDIGVRETIESIIVAIILALMFRAYEAEAFIIPTGSMAPSLQGQHMDLECGNCGVRYRSGASYEASTAEKNFDIESTFCPICQYRTRMSSSDPDHVSNKGDRILVNKFIYDFQDPERFDVIVFKNPNNGKQNYIKRLIGLPGDNILIENGDIYVMPLTGEGTYGKEIARKPARKLRHILQAVDDTDHIGPNLESIQWPSRWQPFDGLSNWKIQESDGHPNFYSQPTEQTNWLRYRHYQPLKEEWPTILAGQLPERFRGGKLPLGRLIGDQYAYNDGKYVNSNAGSEFRQNLGLHWVGDIGLECWANVKSSQGKLLLDVVEGGAHFTCEIDVASGLATLMCDDSRVDTKVTFENEAGQTVEKPTGQTNLKGPGEYHIEYVNADDRIHLWINNRLIDFDAANYTRAGIPIPTYDPQDPGDAEPVGVGSQGLEVDLSRLKVVRDIYYTSANSEQPPYRMDNETMNPVEVIEEIHRNPELWSMPEAIKMFRDLKGRTKPMFKLERGATSAQDQFLPMGDNSPQSYDGRVWDGPKYVERDMLIGRAMLIYWPHMKNVPYIKYFPIFERMDFIR